ncbi:MAG: globin [Pseudomonadales bacterium]
MTFMALENPIFEASYRRLFGEQIAIDDSGAQFFRDFYQHFLQRPSIGDMFTAVDMERQIKMLRKSLYQLIACYLFDAPNADLRRLALLHRRLGITDAMLDSWLQALLETVEQHDPMYNTEVGLAWCWALTPGITFMKHSLLDEAHAL